MTTLRTPLARLFLVFALVAVALAACQKPAPPQLTPKEVKVTGASLEGLDLRVKMDAFNPNGFELAVRSVVAHIVIDGTQDLGTVTASQPIVLPANAHTLVDVPLSVKWKGVGGLATIAGARKPVPYTVDGTASVGGEHLNVDVPFKLQGVITPEQAAEAAARSIGKLGLPGLQGLPGLLPPK
jgi:LEA14-like dessication related protein